MAAWNGVTPTRAVALGMPLGTRLDYCNRVATWGAIVTSAGTACPPDGDSGEPDPLPQAGSAAARPSPATPRRTATSRSASTHGHLWFLPDGTGLHAPYGELVVEAGTGRVCCHLCGRWFVSLGGHLRTHGHTAESYREAMGLCRTRRLVAEGLSRSIAARQASAYRRSPALRARLATGQRHSRTGHLAGLARTARGAAASPELVRIRRTALATGRATRATRREQDLARRLRELGADNLAAYLHQAYAAGASLRQLGAATGLGYSRLRREIDAAGVVLRPAGPRREQRRDAPGAG